jgi:hypothetical protein
MASGAAWPGVMAASTLPVLMVDRAAGKPQAAPAAVMVALQAFNIKAVLQAGLDTAVAVEAGISVELAAFGIMVAAEAAISAGLMA